MCNHEIPIRQSEKKIMFNSKGVKEKENRKKALTQA